MSITLLIIIVTCLVSIVAFSNEKLFDDLIFYPPAVSEQKQWYRFFTCGFIHANFPHLLFNMYSLWIFGESVELQFQSVYAGNGKWLYLLMYLSSLYVCLLPTYAKNKDNYSYRSLGASGAVSAVVFAFIFFDPTRSLSLIIIPGLSFPGFLFGLVYLIISSYLDKRGGGNINHSAHIWGALYGISFIIVAGYIFSDYKLLHEFIEKVKYYFQTF